MRIHKEQLADCAWDQFMGLLRDLQIDIPKVEKKLTELIQQ
jgi:hypothetical protein